jgi:hypothetical protein
LSPPFRKLNLAKVGVPGVGEVLVLGVAGAGVEMRLGLTSTVPKGLSHISQRCIDGWLRYVHAGQAMSTLPAPPLTAGESGRDGGVLCAGVPNLEGLLDVTGVADSDFVTPHSVHLMPAETSFLKPQT